MPAVNIAPYIRNQYFNDSGVVLAGGLLNCYEAGTSTRKTTYSEAGGTIENANPIVLDAAGRAQIYMSTGAYKFVLTDSAGATIWTEDNVTINTVTTSVDTVAEMVALTGGSASIIRTLGYAAVNDGGGWWFYWDSTSTATDDGGMVIQPSTLPITGRWIGFIPDVNVLNVRVYGAVCNSDTDDISNLQACDVYCAANGCIILIDSTIYVSTDPTLSSKIKLMPSAQFKYGSFNPVLDIVVDGNDKTRHFNCGIAYIPTLNVNELYPEWFGENSTTHPITTAVIAAITDSKTRYYLDTTLTAGAGSTSQFVDVDISGTLDSHGVAHLYSSLEVDGLLNADAGADIEGAVDIAGVLTLQSQLNADAGADIEGNVDINGTLDSHGAVRTYSTLQVDGLINADAGADIEGVVDIAGVLTLQSELNADAGADIEGAVNIAGVLTLQSELNADAGADIEGNVDIAGTLDVHNDLYGYNPSQFYSSLQVDGTLLAMDQIQNATAGEPLFINDNARIAGTLVVDGDVTATVGQVGFSEGITVAGITASDDIDLAGNHLVQHVAGYIMTLGQADTGFYWNDGLNVVTGYYGGADGYRHNFTNGNIDMFSGGLAVGAPTGDNMGDGTINAEGVFDDSMILTGYVLDKAYNPDFKIEDWDKKAKDGKEHVPAREFIGRVELMLDIDKYCDFVKTEKVLPTFESVECRDKNNLPSNGAMIQKLWEVVEIQAIQIAELNDRLKTLETNNKG